MDCCYTKQSLRTEVRNRINAMTEAERKFQSLSVCRQILATPEWTKASSVMLYEALPDEVNLSLLFSEASRQGKKVFSPQPTADAPMLSESILQQIDLIIVPGRAFTLKGDRMGRGKGYYDRILSYFSSPTSPLLLPYTHPTTFGAAFSCQIFDSIPTDEWDRPLSQVVVGNYFQTI